MTLLNGQKYHYSAGFSRSPEDQSGELSDLGNQRVHALAEVKRAVAERWVTAVNADGTGGSGGMQSLRKYRIFLDC